MEQLPNYDNWKTTDDSPAAMDTVMCDYCGETILLDDAQEYRGVYVCPDCLANLEADDEEFEDDEY